MTFDPKMALEALIFLLGLIGHAWFLGSRIQKIEDACNVNDRLLREHIRNDREDFRRLGDKIDGKSDRQPALFGAG